MKIKKACRMHALERSDNLKNLIAPLLPHHHRHSQYHHRILHPHIDPDFARYRYHPVVDRAAQVKLVSSPCQQKDMEERLTSPILGTSSFFGSFETPGFLSKYQAGEFPTRFFILMTYSRIFTFNYIYYNNNYII